MFIKRLRPRWRDRRVIAVCVATLPARFLCLHCIVGLLFVAAPALAREEGGDGETLEPVEVGASAPTADEPVNGYVATQVRTGTKTDTPIADTPQSISVVTSEQMEDRGDQTLSDTVRYTAGVEGSPFGYEPRYTFIRMRGFDVTDNALYRDGLKMVNPPVVGGSGATVSYRLEPYGAQRVVIPRGPASVLYGQASPGGLVNYISKRPTRAPLREIELEAGNHEHLAGKADLSGPIDERGHFSYRLTGLVKDSETQVDYIDDDRVFVAPALSWRPGGDTTLTLLTHYQNDDTKSSQAYPANGTLDDNPNGKIPRDRFTGEPSIDRYERTHKSAGYQLEHAFTDRLTVRQNLRYERVELDDVSVYASSVLDDRRVGRAYFGNFGELDALTVDNQIEVRLGDDGVRHVVLAGVDYQHAELDSLQEFGAAPPLDVYDPRYGQPVDTEAATPFAGQTGAQEQTGVYLQDQVTVSDRWVFSLAGRYDWATRRTRDHLTATSGEQDDEAFTGRAGVLYRAENGVSPYFSYSESFLPSLGEDATGEPFEPETGRQYEVGVKYQPLRWNGYITVAAFDLERRDYVEYEPATFLNVQTGEARTRGVEVEAVASLAPGLDVTASYTYLDAEITESATASEVGNRPRLTAEHKASVWADHTVGDGFLQGVGIGAGVRYRGSVYGDDANRSKVPGVTLVDAGAHYDWQRYRARLTVRNLFDKHYVASSFTRGGDFFATYGEARTVIATLGYRW